MNRQEFEVTLLRPPDIDGAYFLVPFNVPEVYGTKAQVKKQETRENRIKKAIEMIAEGRKR
jgi:hypothetical protein